MKPNQVRFQPAILIQNDALHPTVAKDCFPHLGNLHAEFETDAVWSCHAQNWVTLYQSHIGVCHIQNGSQPPNINQNIQSQLRNPRAKLGVPSLRGSQAFQVRRERLTTSQNVL